MTDDRDHVPPDTPQDDTGAGAAGDDGPADFGAGKGPAEADTPGDPQVEPDAGGYAGRDPKTEMPRMPSVPETQKGDQAHGGEPPQDSEPPASN